MACCWRATASARSKYASAFAASGSRRHQRDFAGDAIDLGLAPPFLGCFHRRHRFANAAPSVIELAEVPHRLCAKCDKYNGIQIVAPVDRNAVMPEVIIRTASEALPVRAKSTTLHQHSVRLPEHGAFFVRQSDKLIEIARLLSRNFRKGYGSAM